ncbi:hypothetical protein [Sorangium cellulosum]|uniref:Uncharacterized protein n=1 Tax=Sorangium cellulosum So0157-2 TaxID=1254432 RepID=S4XZK2_SORCE|nr:hypothetical protein [Sorangium cellulosum]AGP36033.1 hypothetical protein SCE1572_16900 [Sorangium cellulosum So0157-2]
MNGLFNDNHTLELVPEGSGAAAPVGYVFASAGDGGVSQVQRWILYKTYQPFFVKKIELRVPSSPSRRYSSLSAWKAAVTGALWQDGATYVKVNSAVSSAIAGAKAPKLPDSIRPPLSRISVEHAPALNASAGREGAAEVSIDARRAAQSVAGAGQGDLEAERLSDRALRRIAGAGLSRPTRADELDDAVPAQIQIRALLLQRKAGAPDVVAHVYGTDKVNASNADCELNYEYWVVPPQYQPLPASAQGGRSTILDFTTASQKTTTAKFLAEMAATSAQGSQVVAASCVYFKQLPQSI